MVCNLLVGKNNSMLWVEWKDWQTYLEMKHLSECFNPALTQLPSNEKGWDSLIMSADMQMSDPSQTTNAKHLTLKSIFHFHCSILKKFKVYLRFINGFYCLSFSFWILDGHLNGTTSALASTEPSLKLSRRLVRNPALLTQYFRCHKQTPPCLYLMITIYIYFFFN